MELKPLTEDDINLCKFYSFRYDEKKIFEKREETMTEK